MVLAQANLLFWLPHTTRQNTACWQLIRKGSHLEHCPSHSLRWHMQHSTMLAERAGNTWCAFCAKSTFEIFSAVGAQPKFALVDTFSHASCKNRRNGSNQGTIPTT